MTELLHRARGHGMAGAGAVRLPAAFRGWWAFFLLPAAVVIAAPDSWPPWALMWSVAAAVYAGCKWLSWRRSGAAAPSRPRLAGYLLAWPGMDARAFLEPAALPPVPAPRAQEWAAAALKLALGAALLFGAAQMLPARYDLAVGWTGMAGIVTGLHFGLFRLLSCAWRAAGVDAAPVMDNPAASRTLGEFWGRRWNVAFRDLAFRHIFRPLMARLGPRAGAFLGFLASGLAHDLVISWPARGGYGLPTAYFLIQGAGLLAERGHLRRALATRAGLVGRLWTAAVTLLPAAILFHPPFVRRVVLPFMEAIGAI